MHQVLKIQEQIIEELKKYPKNNEHEFKDKFIDWLEDLAQISLEILDLPENSVESFNSKVKEMLFSFLGFVSSMENIFYQFSPNDENALNNNLIELKNIYDQYLISEETNESIQKFAKIGLNEYFEFDE